MKFPPRIPSISASLYFRRISPSVRSNIRCGWSSAFDVDLLAKTVAALVARAELPVQLRRHVVVAIEIDVAADAEVLRARSA